MTQLNNKLQPLRVEDITGDDPRSKSFYWVQYSPRVAQIQAALFQPVTYLQFPDWESAHKFFVWVTDKHSLRCKVREAERFPGGWECKTWGVSEALLARLVERDRLRHSSAYRLRPTPPTPLPVAA